MSTPPSHVFLSYSPTNLPFVESLARRLQGDARLSFWFAPWHADPGLPIQEQLEEALWQANACAIFIGAGPLQGWQNEEMRLAIRTRVEEEPGYRIIPVFSPGSTQPDRRELPRFLRRYFREDLKVAFHSVDDESAFKRLLAGILGIAPIEVEGFIETVKSEVRQAPPPSGVFAQGHALVVGIANYPRIRRLSKTVLNDARDLASLLTNAAHCGYPTGQVTQLLDEQATGSGIRDALTALSTGTDSSDTVVVFFSGHGAHRWVKGEYEQFILPYDFDPDDLLGTAISGHEMTERLRKISAGRLLVLFDSCHSGGAAEPKGGLALMKRGLSEDYYQALAQGKGRVVIASSRPDEESLTLPVLRNSLFTHYLLEALRGKGKTQGDGYVRVFDLFRHVADHVSQKADQHPIFKAAAMEEDWPVALVPIHQSIGKGFVPPARL
jgi:hypothetical protein